MTDLTKDQVLYLSAHRLIESGRLPYAPDECAVAAACRDQGLIRWSPGPDCGWFMTDKGRAARKRYFDSRRRRPPLTRRQKQVYDFVAGYIDRHGIAPAFEEIRAAVGLGSKSSVARLVDMLESKRWVRRYRYRHRSLTIVGETAR